ncbi:MAG: TonB-dependent receptor [Dysgonamonadaceae bacterium]|jgi:TonB-linked SusC/RagA family outer membrane protein|nr:TonB-dependent receptor [Dysgonamonadaceae bacterium]
MRKLKKYLQFHFAAGKIKTVLCAAALMANLGVLQAQTSSISGKVIDDTGEPLTGATVLVKGTNNAVITNLGGNYTIEAEKNSTLVFSYVGMKPHEEVVNGRGRIDVELQSGMNIEEVVVVGYGTMKKSDLTGAVAKVSAEDLKQLSTIDVGQALAGRVAGVDVISNSGEPGSGTKIRIRGYGSMNTSDPLYVVDGFPVSDVDYLSPQDIESLEILKDASATAIYGSRGANGVVLIKTRGGRYNSHTRVEANVYGSMSLMGRNVELLNAWEYATLKKELFSNSGMPISAQDAAMFNFVIDNKYTGTDWVDEVSRTGFAQNYNVDVSGGSDRHTFSVGATYSATQGVLKYNELDAITARINNTYKLSSDISLGINIIYTNRKTQGGGGDGNYYGSIWPAVMRADPISMAWDEHAGTWGEVLFADPSYQPARQIYEGANYGNNSSNMFIGNTFLQFDNIAKIKGLSIRAQYGVRANFGETLNYSPVYYVSADQNRSNSSLSVGRTNFNSWLANAYLMYNKSFDKHSIGLTLGTEAQDFRFTMLSGSAQDIPEAENMWYLNQTGTPSSRSASHSSPFWNRMASFFARGNYTYDGRYLLTATVRADGSSKFLNHWGYFPSFSLGWNLHQEAFMQTESNPFQMLKFRAGYGLVGNESSAGASDYVALMSSGYNAVIGDALQTGYIQLEYANANLQWEASEQYNFGLDFMLLKSKLSGTIDYFIRNTRDMILKTPVPMYAGLSRPSTNSGEMRNNGLELTLRWADRKDDFSYSIGANASFIKNKVLALGSPDPVYGTNMDKLQQPFTRTEVGMEMAYFYGYKTGGIFQTQDEINNYKTPDGRLIQPSAQPGDVKFLKIADDGEPLSIEDRTYLGSGMADVTFGMNATVAWKGIDLSLFLQSSVGNEIANAAVMDLYSSNFGQWNMSKEMMNRWTGPGSTNQYPRLSANDFNQNSRFSDRYIEDGSYLRIKNLQLGYTLPKGVTEKLKIQRLRIYASADNLYVFTKYSGFDPEMGDYLRQPLNNGIDLASYPRPRTFVLGFNITL